MSVSLVIIDSSGLNPDATLLRAVRLARHVPTQLQAAFGLASAQSRTNTPARSAPLIFTDLVRGVASPSVRFETRTYAIRGTEHLELDLYHPASTSGLAPCVIVVHGGSWNHGYRTDLAPLNHYLAARGYSVASVSYRFAPQHPFPAAADDIRAAMTYLKEHAAELQLDPHQLVLLGRSSGGHLALLVAYTLHDPDIQGVVSFYGPADLQYSYNHPSRYPSVFNTRKVLNDFLGGTPDEVPTLYRNASPINFVDFTTPPTLLIQGGRDEFFVPEEGKRLEYRLATAGVPHLLLTLPWATHGGDFNFSGPSGQISTYAIEHFLSVVLHLTN